MLVAGLAEHPPPAQLAEQVGAQQVGPLGVRVVEVGTGAAARAEAVAADLLDLEVGVQADQRLVDRFG